MGHNNHKTSWEGVSTWYAKQTRDDGHYFHKHVILPKLDKLLELTNTSSVLDVGCGSGVLTTIIPKECMYFGIDTSPSLINAAKQKDKNPNHTYIVSDATLPYTLPQTITHAVFLLSLQNMKNPDSAIQQAAKHLAPNGTLTLILNHPIFRIPRVSSWGTDTNKKIQYRRIDRYLTPMEIPISMSPGQQQSPTTWSYHNPLQNFIMWLAKTHLAVTLLEEWTSDKTSIGKAARMENRARGEFPLFMTIVGQKITLSQKP